MKRRERFAKAFRRTYPKAVEILEKDWERMVAFYDFPKEHWKHLRTTNVVESPFAAVRLRTDAAKRFKKTENAVGWFESTGIAMSGSWDMPADRNAQARAREYGIRCHLALNEDQRRGHLPRRTIRLVQALDPRFILRK